VILYGIKNTYEGMSIKEMHDSNEMIIEVMRKIMPHVTAKDIAQADTETTKYLEDLRNKYNEQ